MTYTPSGNPGTRADGLSATMRTEFQAIGDAFAALPSITTTGVFSTVFAQLGSFTFTLPNGAGTLARTSDVTTAVATETTDRTTAVAAEATTRAAGDATNATAITAETTRATAAEALLAPKLSPAFTGQTTITQTTGPGSAVTIATTLLASSLCAFLRGATSVGSITTDGTNTTSYNTTSDETLKDIAGPVTPADSGHFIDGLQPIWFTWKDDPCRELQPGFGAQTTANVFPWAVTPGGEGAPWAMDPAKLMVAAVAEIKALRARVEALERGAA